MYDWCRSSAIATEAKARRKTNGTVMRLNISAS
jgi:hypothetical protein